MRDERQGATFVRDERHRRHGVVGMRDEKHEKHGAIVTRDERNAMRSESHKLSCPPRLLSL